MPQKWILVAVRRVCTRRWSADAGLYGGYRLEVSERDELALWGSYAGPYAFLELGCSWTRESVELSLVADVFEGETTPDPAQPQRAREILLLG